MERIQSVNIERIEWACHEYGITSTQLAPSVGVPDSTIKRLMTGDGITPKNLEKIADFFGYGLLFFLEKGPIDVAEMYTPQFRTILNRKPQLSRKLRQFVDRVEKQREVYLALLEILEVPGVAFAPPDVTDQSNGPVVALDWLNISNGNSFESSRTKVEEKGVLVFQSNGYAGPWQIPKSDPIVGFSIHHSPYPVIVVKKESPQRQLFTLMHELAHLLIHKTSWVDDMYDLESYVAQEQEANAFAGRVLVPDAVLENVPDQNRPADVAKYDDWLRDIRQTWGVSSEVVLRRLLDRGRLPQDRYTAYRDWKNSTASERQERGSRLYRHREPIHIFGDGFVRTVLTALEAN